MSDRTRTDDPLASESLQVGVAGFSHIAGAERAYADARDRDLGARWMSDAAFVEVHRDGRIVTRGTVLGHYVDVDGEGDVIGPGTGRGAVVGAAIGLLLGPAALADGLVGGATVGGVVEASHGTKQHGPVFEAIRQHLPEGSSAVVVVSDVERVQAMFGALAGVAEQWAQYRLSVAAEAELRSALAEAPPSAPADPATSR
jgi:uncharacterized membrane protein